MEDIDAETYGKLYAAHKNDMPPMRLLSGVDLKGKVAWDLCCGIGMVATDMVARGARYVLAVDGSHEMLKSILGLKEDKMLESVEVCCMSAEVFLLMDYLRGRKKPDVVVCRGQTGTWLNENTAKKLAEVMKPDSVFVFDGPMRRPMRKPSVIEYEFDGKWFAELSWAVGDGMCHVQAREGMKPHVVWARSLFLPDVMGFLGSWFVITVSRDAGAAVYTCRRKA